MKKQKQEVTSKQIYRRNKKKAKIFQVLAPVVTVVFLLLSVIFCWQMIENSVGNVVEINNLLDKDIYNETEIQENYDYLIDKWGEWETGATSGGVKITYVNVMAALFSGLMKMYMGFMIASLLIAIAVGKILLPFIVRRFVEENDTLVDLANLETLDCVLDATGKKERTKRKKEDWF